MDLVFISHVAEDSSLAVQVARGLEDAGYSAWYYERDSVPGPSYLDQILTALDHTRTVVALVSPAALASWQVEKEVVQAHERGLSFIPLLYGLSHEELRAARPSWAMAFGAAVSLPLPTDADITLLLPQIVAGVRWLAGQPAVAGTPPGLPGLPGATTAPPDGGAPTGAAPEPCGASGRCGATSAKGAAGWTGSWPTRPPETTPRPGREHCGVPAC